jgi:hypothetical protein
MIGVFRHGQITFEGLVLKIEQCVLFLPWLGIDGKPVRAKLAQNIHLKFAV